MEGGVGIRIFRDRLTRYVARVRRGQRVVITDRGKPVAVLVPYASDDANVGKGRLAQILASGHVDPADRPLRKAFPPVRGKGRLPSRIIVETRQ